MRELKYLEKILAALMDARIAVGVHNFPRLRTGLLKLFCTCPTIHQVYIFATPRLYWCNNAIVHMIQWF